MPKAVRIQNDVDRVDHYLIAQQTLTPSRVTSMTHYRPIDIGCLLRGFWKDSQRIRVSTSERRLHEVNPQKQKVPSNDSVDVFQALANPHFRGVRGKAWPIIPSRSALRQLYILFS